MPEPVIRKIATAVEDIYHEGGPVAATPLRRAAVIAVIKNPFAGRYETEIQGFIDDLRPLGLMMATKLVKIIGGAGELEHGALWHAPGGYAMRTVIGGSQAIVPSSKKVGGVGCRLDVPLGHKDAAYVRSHFDGVELRLNDAPRANEILVAVAVTDSGRPLPRVGGLTADQAIGEDGLK